MSLAWPLVFLGALSASMMAADAVALRAAQGREAAPLDPPPPTRVTRPSGLPLRALGTLDHDWVAIEKEGQIRGYALGDVVYGARIVTIDRSLITLRERDALTYLEVVGDVVPLPIHTSVTGVRTMSPEDLKRWQHKAWGPPDDHCPSGRPNVPFTRDFTLTRVPEGCLWDQLGLRERDRVVQIDREPLVPGVPESVLQFVKLWEVPLEVEIERNGACIGLTIQAP
jgi:hypothetical protein